MLSKSGLFYFRMRLPDGKEYRRALGTSDKHEARRLAALHLSAIGHNGATRQHFSGASAGSAESAESFPIMTAQEQRAAVDQYIQRIHRGRKLIAAHNRLDPYVDENMIKLYNTLPIGSLNDYVITWIHDHSLVTQLKAESSVPFTLDQMSEVITKALAQNGQKPKTHTGRSDIPLKQSAKEMLEHLVNIKNRSPATEKAYTSHLDTFVLIMSKHLGKTDAQIMSADLTPDALAFYLRTIPNLVCHTGRGRTEIRLADNPAEKMSPKTIREPRRIREFESFGLRLSG
jgi:hypothetical protein